MPYQRGGDDNTESTCNPRLTLDGHLDRRLPPSSSIPSAIPTAEATQHTDLPLDAQSDYYEMADYGTAKHSGEDDHEPTSPEGAGESSALLGGAPVTRELSDGHATIVSCVSNLCNTIIGSGQYTCHSYVVFVDFLCRNVDLSSRKYPHWRPSSVINVA